MLEHVSVFVFYCCYIKKQLLVDFIYAHSSERCCPKNFNLIDGREGKRVAFREVQRGKRCNFDTNTEGAHPQSSDDP